MNIPGLDLTAHEAPAPHVLRLIREQLGFSQAEFATALQFTLKSGERRIRRWEKDRANPPKPQTWAAIKCLITNTKSQESVI